MDINSVLKKLSNGILLKLRIVMNTAPGLVSQQQTRLDKRTRGNKQHSPDRDNVGPRYVLQHRTSHGPVSQIQGDKPYSLDRDNIGSKMCWNIGRDKVQLYKRSGTNRKVLSVITLTQNIGQNNGPLEVQICVNVRVISMTHIRVV